MAMNSVLEISADQIRISVQRGFLLLVQENQEQKVPLSEIEALLINSHGAYISNAAIMRLSEAGIPIVHCSKNAMPCALTLPYGSNVYRKERIHLQISASLPLKKNLWQCVTIAKILNQAAVLNLAGKRNNDLVELSKKVLSGDKGNCEAIAARIYWERLFGKGFKRKPELEGINSFLNYGYAILRATMCRAIVAAGLLPELGIHHHNQMNPYCLADDLMEPYRPFIDLMIHTMGISDSDSLMPDSKKLLVGILYLWVEDAKQKSPLRNRMFDTVSEYVNSLKDKKILLDYPLIDSGIVSEIKERVGK